MTDVLIKNMPLVYLKDQKEAFFTSPEFQGAKELFDKYKTPVSGDTDSAKNENPLLPIDLLRSLLVHIYSDEVLIIESDEQRQDLLFIALSGVQPMRQEITPRKYITRSAKDITNFTGNFLVTTVSDSLFIKEWRTAFQRTKEKGIYDMIDVSKGTSSYKTKPENTSNVIKDITDKAKFYSEVLDSTVYDDAYYRNKIFTKIIKDSIEMNMDVLPTTSLKNRLDALYPAPIRDMQKMCDSLRERIMAKYYNQKFDFRDTNLIYNTSVASTAVDKEVEAITATLSVQNGLYPLSILRVPIIVSDYTQPLEIDMGNLRGEYRYNLFTKEGVLSNSLVESIDLDENGKLTLKISENCVGELQLLTDRHSKERIHQYTLFDYYKDLSGKRMEKYEIKRSLSKTLIRLRGLNDGYFFFDIREKDSWKPVEPLSVEVDEDGITLDLTNSSTLLEIVILPTSEVLGGINKVKVTESTIKDVIANINFFDKEIRVWVGARLNDR